MSSRSPRRLRPRASIHRRATIREYLDPQRGLVRAVAGAKVVAQTLAQPTVISGEPHMLGAHPDEAVTKRAVTDVLEGGMEALLPLLAVSAYAAPLKTALASSSGRSCSPMICRVSARAASFSKVRGLTGYL